MGSPAFGTLAYKRKLKANKLRRQKLRKLMFAKQKRIKEETAKAPMEERKMMNIAVENAIMKKNDYFRKFGAMSSV